MGIRYKSEIPNDLEKLLGLLQRRGGERMSDNFQDVLEAEISIIFRVFFGINLECDEEENPLSFRERVCLALYCLGKYQKQVAALMKVTEGSVKVYYSRIRGKLDVTSNQAALLKAVSSGYLRPY